jgi:hypothetical protein
MILEISILDVILGNLLIPKVIGSEITAIFQSVIFTSHINLASFQYNLKFEPFFTIVVNIHFPIIGPADDPNPFD